VLFAVTFDHVEDAEREVPDPNPIFVEAGVFVVVQPEVVLLGDVETFLDDLGKILLLQTIVAPVLVLAGQQQTDDGVQEGGRAVALEDNLEKLLGVVGLLDSSQVAEPVEELDQRLELQDLASRQSPLVLLNEGRQGGLQAGGLRTEVVLEAIHVIQNIKVTEPLPPFLTIIISRDSNILGLSSRGLWDGHRSR
jgi:hypothetical protein